MTSAKATTAQKVMEKVFTSSVIRYGENEIGRGGVEVLEAADAIAMGSE